MGVQYQLMVVGRRGNTWLWDLATPPTVAGEQLVLWTRAGTQLHLDDVYTVTFQAKVSGTWQFVLPADFSPPSGAPPGAAGGAAAAAAAAVTTAAAAATTTAAPAPFLVGQGYDLVVVAPVATRGPNAMQYELRRPAGVPESEHLTLWTWPFQQIHLGKSYRLIYHSRVGSNWTFLMEGTLKTAQAQEASTTAPPRPGEPAAAPVQPAAPAASTAAATQMAPQVDPYLHFKVLHDLILDWWVSGSWLGYSLLLQVPPAAPGFSQGCHVIPEAQPTQIIHGPHAVA